MVGAQQVFRGSAGAPDWWNESFGQYLFVRVMGSEHGGKDSHNNQTDDNGKPDDQSLVSLDSPDEQLTGGKLSNRLSLKRKRRAADWKFRRGHNVIQVVSGDQARH